MHKNVCRSNIRHAFCDVYKKKCILNALFSHPIILSASARRAPQHAECLSSLQLEEVVTFEHGPDAGLPAHERVAAVAAREADRLRGVKSKGSVG